MKCFKPCLLADVLYLCFSLANHICSQMLSLSSLPNCQYQIGFCLCQVVPRWHEHWTSNKVYDGDMIVLQGQEKIFLSKSMEGSADVNKEYTKLTFTPTQADRFVLAFRNWLRQHGNGKPEWFGFIEQQPLPSTVLSKRQV